MYVYVLIAIIDNEWGFYETLKWASIHNTALLSQDTSIVRSSHIMGRLFDGKL